MEKQNIQAVHRKASRFECNKYCATTARVLALVGIAIVLVTNSWAASSENVLYRFQGFLGQQADGFLPSAGVTLGPDGAIYGTTLYGGTGGCLLGCGTVFRLAPAKGGGFTETIIHNFQGILVDGQSPTSSVVFDHSGNLYGTAPGGTHGCGIVYQLTPTQGGEWTETILHNFDAFGGHKDGCLDGGGSNLPTSSLVFDSKGNLYGTTNKGGGGDSNFFCTNGCGTVFQMTPNADGTWKERVLHSFPKFGRSTDGSVPEDGLLIDASGNLHGTTYLGGPNGAGIVFRLAPVRGGVWKETILFRFRSKATGEGPRGGVVMDNAGNLYGTTTIAGACNQCAGLVFKLSPTSKGEWKETVIHTFNTNNHNDGVFPQDGLAIDSSGNLFGTTLYGGGKGMSICGNTDGCGTVYELSPSANGGFAEHILFRFAAGQDGGVPLDDRLVMDTAGNLYGTSSVGGTVIFQNGDTGGVVYKFAR